jgi:hypothetical protein
VPLSAKSGAGVLAERAADGDEDIVVFGFVIDFCLGFFWLLYFCCHAYDYV